MRWPWKNRLPTSCATVRPLIPSTDLRELQSDLSHAIRAALPRVIGESGPSRNTASPYESIAAILVELRHACKGPNGGADLCGRSAAYRALVRRAYVSAGANPESSLSKRFTAGTAYWVRKILLDRYGEQKLRELGVMTHREIASADSRLPRELHPSNESKLSSLEAAVSVLNHCASDPDLHPPDELVSAAVRAVNLLRDKARIETLNNHAQKVAI